MKDGVDRQNVKTEPEKPKPRLICKTETERKTAFFCKTEPKTQPK